MSFALRPEDSPLREIFVRTPYRVLGQIILSIRMGGGKYLTTPTHFGVIEVRATFTSILGKPTLLSLRATVFHDRLCLETWGPRA